MTAQALVNPLPQFFGRDGYPLSDGSVYFGQPNQDPRQYPKAVYFDEALVTLASQPVRTQVGYLYRNGSATNVWADGSCSVLVLDRSGQQVYYVADWSGIIANVVAAATAGAAAQAVIATTQAGIATTQAGLATTAKTAAETARDDAAASAKLFSTAALGISGTSSGQYFGVQQANSESADLYLNTAGTAVNQNRTIPSNGAGQSAQQIKVAELASANLTNYPYTPAIEVYGVDSYDRNGVYVPNRYAASAPGANLVALSSGKINICKNPASSNLSPGNFEFEEFFTNGPAGKLTAARIKFANNNFWSPLREVLPAGTYTAAWKAKAAPGTTPTIKYGDQNATPGTPLSSVSLNDATWTTVTVTFTASGSNTPWPIFFNQSGATVDFYLDEVQVYAGAVVPAYSTEVNNQGHLVPMTALLPGKFKRSGNALDTTTITGGVLRFSTYPLPKSVTEMTIIGLVSLNDNATAAAKVMSLTDAGGSFDIGTYYGAPMGNPAQVKGQTVYNGGVGPDAASNMMNIAGKGYHFLATRAKATEQSFFWHSIEYARRVAAWGPISMAKLSAFCDSDQASFPFKGKCTALLVFDKWLTNTELNTVFQSLRQRHALYGQAPVTTGFNFIISEGDSITDAYAAPSGSYVNLYFNTVPANVYCKNIASSGSTYASMLARLPEIQRMAPQTVALTGKPLILSTFIGANGVPTTTEMTTYWAAARAAGAKIVACTILPRSGVSGFEASRTAFNTWVRANSSLYDALCDFGDTSSVMGQPNSYVDTPANWNDVTHPSAAGHALLMPIWRAAVQSLMT